MQPVAADEREEGREEGAARAARALRDHAGELVDLEDEEAGAEQAGRSHRAVEHGHRCALRADAGQAAGEAREQQAGGLDRDIVQIEELPPARARPPSRPTSTA